MTEKKTDKYYRGLTEVGYHFDGRDGLYLQISKSGSKSWVCKFTYLGKTYEQGLGGFPKVSLATARRLAAQKRAQLDSGVRPLGKREVRQQQLASQNASTKSGKTFKECAEAYIAAHEAGWKNAKHAAQWRNTLKTYAYPLIGDLPVSAISVGNVMEVLEPIWTTKTETAGRVRGRLESILDWATVRGYRSGENPARWRGHLDKLLPKRSAVRQVKHHEALPYQQVPAFVQKLREIPGVSSSALEFVILTAARTGEAINAEWGEFDLAASLWVVPAGRMKAKREHRVPLSKRAAAVVRSMDALRGEGNMLFPSPAREGRPLSDMALLVLVKRLAGENFTTHGFRSSFRDWASEQTNFPSEVVEMALAHTVKDKVEAAYRRGDLFEKRRKLMQAWADYCSSQKQSGKVVSFNRSKSA